MKIYLLSLGLLIGSLQGALAQKGNLTGKIRDTLDKISLARSSVSLLRAGDSVLYKFTRSDVNGVFVFNEIDTGDYILLVLQDRFADYFDQVHIRGGETTDLGAVMLTLEAKLLEDVTVRAKLSPMRLKGDTIEYKADSFHLRADATVEDLLKRLPGIQVDRQGKVTAQGQKVDQVLLDGDEFFGSDPTMVMRNMQADAVDKVQVYNRKSDQEKLTGFDDGQRLRTINLQLKEEKKHGFFGKLDLGAGPDDKWNNSGIINAFRAKRKLAAYASMSSTGKAEIDFPDSGPMFDVAALMDNGGAVNTGQGIPKTWNGALNYSNHLNDGKTNIDGYYRYNKQNTETEGAVFSQSLVQDTAFYNTQHSQGFTSRQRNSGNVHFDLTLDSLTRLDLVFRGGRSASFGSNDYSSQAVNGANQLVNQNDHHSTADGTDQDLNLSVMYTHRLKKTGRSFYFMGIYRPQQTSGTGTLHSSTSLYDGAGGKVSVDTVDQLKQTHQHTDNFMGDIGYTDRLFSRIGFRIGYDLNYQHNNNALLSYNKDGAGHFRSLDSLNSSDYLYQTVTQSGAVTFDYQLHALSVTMGGVMSSSAYLQKDHLYDSSTRYTYPTFSPVVFMGYQFKPGTSAQLGYSGQTQAPTLTQVQPVHDNSNPLVIYEGNPHLKQQYSQEMKFTYHSSAVSALSGVDVDATLTTVSRAITINSSIDSFGRTVNQYTNVNGNYNFMFNGSYNMMLTNLHTMLTFRGRENISANHNYVNGLPNETKSYQHGLDLMASFWNRNCQVNLSSEGSYNSNQSSIQPMASTHYWAYNGGLSLQRDVKKWAFNSDINYTFQQRLNAFDKDTYFTTWNAYIGRRVLRDDKGLIKLSCHDILDQNKGYSRVVSNNVLTESTYRQIGRCLQLGFVWNFSYSPVASEATDH